MSANTGSLLTPGIAVRRRRTDRRRGRSPSLRRIELDGGHVARPRPRLAARPRPGLRPAAPRAAVAAADGHDVRASSARAAAHVVVEHRERRARTVADPRHDAPRPQSPLRQGRSIRSASTATATVTTRWPGTATATGKTVVNPFVGDRQRRRTSPVPAAPTWRRPRPLVRPRSWRPVRDGRGLPARLGAQRAEGPPRRAAHLDHVPSRSQRRFREVPRRVWDMSRYVDRRGRAGDPRAGAG